MSLIAILDPHEVRSITKSFARMASKETKKKIRKILRENLKKALPAARANTPEVTGRLRKAIKIRAAKSKKAIAVSLGYGDKDFAGTAFYGGFVEWGYERKFKVIRQGERYITTKKPEEPPKKIPGQLILTRVAEQKGPGIVRDAAREIGEIIFMTAKEE